MSLNRRQIVRQLLEHRGEALLVTGLGASTYDVFAAGDVDSNFYLWGAMGGATMVGLGLAKAQPDRRVVVVTGDGELLMGTGALTVIADQGATNLAVLVLDNGAFGETGRQTGLTARGLDLAHLATGAGFCATCTAREEADLGELTDLIFRREGPVLGVAKVELSNDPVALPARDGPLLTRRFREGLGLHAE